MQVKTCQFEIFGWPVKQSVDSTKNDTQLTSSNIQHCIYVTNECLFGKFLSLSVSKAYCYELQALGLGEVLTSGDVLLPNSVMFLVCKSRESRMWISQVKLLCLGVISETNRCTCFRPNGASTIDYLLTTLDNSKYLTSFNILDRDIYSDHCPLSFRFHANWGTIRRREPNPIPNSYKWDFKHKNIYRKRLSDSVAKYLQHSLLWDIVDKEITPNKVVKKFETLIQQVTSDLFTLKKNKRTCTFPMNS